MAFQMTSLFVLGTGLVFGTASETEGVDGATGAIGAIGATRLFLRAKKSFENLAF